MFQIASIWSRAHAVGCHVGQQRRTSVLATTEVSGPHIVKQERGTGAAADSEVHDCQGRNFRACTEHCKQCRHQVGRWPTQQPLSHQLQICRRYLAKHVKRLDGGNARVISQGEYTHSNTDSMTPQTRATIIALTVALDTCATATDDQMGYSKTAGAVAAAPQSCTLPFDAATTAISASVHTSCSSFTA